MKPRHALFAASLLAIALAGCKPAANADKAVDAGNAPASDTATTDVPAAAPATDPLLEGSDAISIVQHDKPDPQGFDRKAFAGRFSADGTALEIASDGGFVLTETSATGETATTQGSWSVDDAGKRLLLDPDTKEAADRHFEIPSGDELRAVDADGKPLDDDAPLRRG